jgi:hypothetical protein
MGQDLSNFAFNPQEKYSDGKYSFYEISDGTNSHRRINCDVDGICIMPFDLNDHGQIHHIYLQKYLDYFNGTQDYCCVHHDMDPEYDNSHYDALVRICEKELALDDIDVNDIFYLGKVAHTVPFSKTYRCYGVNVSNYSADSVEGFKPAIPVSERDSKNHSLEKVRFTRLLNGSIADSLALSCGCLLLSYIK